MLFVGQLSVVISILLANSLLAFGRESLSLSEKALTPEPQKITEYVEVIKEIPVEVVKEVKIEVPVEIVKEIPVEVVKEVQVMVTDPTHLNLLNEVRSELHEKEILAAHLSEENKKNANRDRRNEASDHGPSDSS